MKIKLHDYDSEFEDDVHYGTCEMCMHVGDAEYPYFYFKYEGDDKTHKVGGFFWSWGELYTVYIDNIPAFAAWLNKQNFDDDYRIEGYADLQALINKYEEEEN